MTQVSQQSGQGHRPGQMTAVMRAVAASGPKVLRIGVVQGGRVVEERIIKERVDVTVGPSERSMFVLSADELRATHKLFELVSGEYVLNFLDGMSGRVALPTGVSELEALKGQARRGAGGSYQIRLTEDSRGKVLVGETTFLFQFVAPPPVQPRPQLPVAVTRGASGIDWPTTIIASFAFMAHFMAIGAMYSDWLDPVVDEQVSLAGLVDTLDRLPPPPPPEEEKEDATDKDKPAEKAKATEKAASSSSKSSSAGSAGPKQGMSSDAKAALRAELEAMRMQAIGAVSMMGSASNQVLQDGDVPTGMLDRSASSGAGAVVGGDLAISGGGGPARPGASSGGLAGLGSTSRGDRGAGQGEVIQGPKASATVKSSMAAGNVSNAASVVNSMKAGFRQCYQRALDKNPDISGKFTLKIKVGGEGQVSGVNSVGESGNLTPDVISCVKARAQQARFAAPDGGTAVIDVPVGFVKQ